MKNIVNDINSSISLSFFDMVTQSDLVIKFVLLILLISSIYSWAIIIKKAILIYQQIKKVNDFEKELWSGKTIEELYQEAKNHSNNLISKVFISAIRAFKEDNTYKSDIIYSLENKKDNIYHSMHIECNKALDILEENIGILATIGSSSPFIGLFGTVWGIMKSFQNITTSHSTSLAVVAPSIAEALLATAVGLIVAIPATIFYNKFTLSITKLSNKFNTFIDEFGSILIKEIR